MSHNGFRTNENLRVQDGEEEKGSGRIKIKGFRTYMTRRVQDV